jgi:hypothetical protein
MIYGRFPEISINRTSQSVGGCVPFNIETVSHIFCILRELRVLKWIILFTEPFLRVILQFPEISENWRNLQFI